MNAYTYVEIGTQKDITHIVEIHTYMYTEIEFHVPAPEACAPEAEACGSGQLARIRDLQACLTRSCKKTSRI